MTTSDEETPGGRMIRERIEAMLSGASEDEELPPPLSPRQELEEELRNTERGLREFRNRPGFDPALLIVMEERIEAIRRELEDDD